MINKKVKDLIENQINKELWSAYLYLDISRFYKEKSLDGFASWFKKQASEEVEHATKFMDYLDDAGESYKLTAIEGSTKTFKDLKEPLVFQLEHEQLVTSLINKIYETAKVEKDYASEKFLSWYIDEQFEEESTAKQLIDKYDLIAGDKAGLYQLDKELAERE